MKASGRFEWGHYVGDRDLVTAITCQLPGDFRSLQVFPTQNISYSRCVTRHRKNTIITQRVGGQISPKHANGTDMRKLIIIVPFLFANCWM